MAAAGSQPLLIVTSEESIVLSLLFLTFFTMDSSVPGKTVTIVRADGVVADATIQAGGAFTFIDVGSTGGPSEARVAGADHEISTV